MGSAAEEREDQRFVDPLILQIREQWRRRQGWHRAEKSLTLAASATCRRYVGVKGKADKAGLKRAATLLKRIEDQEESGDAAMAVMPFIIARAQLVPHRLAAEKTLEQLTRQLPIAVVVKETFGLGLLGLAGIIGEAGDLSEYRTVQAVWKRMGLAVIEGERQGRRTDAIEALKHGYVPARRSVMWNVGNSLIGAMGLGPRPRVGESIEARNDWSRWQKMFVTRLRFEAERDPEHRRDDVERDGERFESYSKHAANRAKRHVEKMFLKFLTVRWRELR